MKHLFYIILFGSFCSCSEEKLAESQTETEYQIDSMKLSANPLNGDTIFAHQDTIKYWKWEDYGPYQYWEEPGLTTMRFKDFKFRIDGDFSKESWGEPKDTMFINEDVGWYLPGRSMWIEAKNESDKFEVSLAVEQRIWEQFDYAWYQDTAFDYSKWEAQSYQRSERSDFYPLEDSSGYFRIPSSFSNFFHDRFLEEYEYDTLTNYVSSEGGGSYATFAINGKPCCWQADYGIIKITRTTVAGIKSEHFFKVFYSYGC